MAGEGLWGTAMQHLFQQTMFVHVYSDFIFIAPAAVSKDDIKFSAL